MNLKRWLIACTVLLVVLVAGGPYFYTHVIESKAPKKLSLSSEKTGLFRNREITPIRVPFADSVGAIRLSQSVIKKIYHILSRLFHEGLSYAHKLVTS